MTSSTRTAERTPTAEQGMLAVAAIVVVAWLTAEVATQPPTRSLSE